MFFVSICRLLFAFNEIHCHNTPASLNTAAASSSSLVVVLMSHVSLVQSLKIHNPNYRIRVRVVVLVLREQGLIIMSWMEEHGRWSDNCQCLSLSGRRASSMWLAAKVSATQSIPSKSSVVLSIKFNKRTDEFLRYPRRECNIKVGRVVVLGALTSPAGHLVDGTGAVALFAQPDGRWECHCWMKRSIGGAKDQFIRNYKHLQCC